MWHAEISALVLRKYAPGGNYAGADPFVAVAFAKTLGPKSVFIEGCLRSDGQPLTVSDWRSLARLLRDSVGIQTIQAVHGGEPFSIETARAGRAVSAIHQT